MKLIGMKFDIYPYVCKMADQNASLRLNNTDESFFLCLIAMQVAECIVRDHFWDDWDHDKLELVLWNNRSISDLNDEPRDMAGPLGMQEFKDTFASGVTTPDTLIAIYDGVVIFSMQDIVDNVARWDDSFIKSSAQHICPVCLTNCLGTCVMG